MSDLFDAPFPLLPAAPEVAYSLPAPPADAVGWRWVPYGETVTLGGLSIEGGMLYVGRGLKGDGNQPDPALIDTTLPVGSSLYDMSRMDGGYWPSYSRLSRNNRKAYLQWLARGRCDPTADIGYVFLYFYGLERRVLRDHANLPFSEIGEEAARIAEEVSRLLHIYGGDPSFFRYASTFKRFAEANAISPERYRYPAPLPGQGSRLEVAVALQQLSAAELPIDEDWALAWLDTSAVGEHHLNPRRGGELTEWIFRVLYKLRHPEGVYARVPRRPHSDRYLPASNGFRGIQFLLKSSADSLYDMCVELAPVTQTLAGAADHTRKLLGAAGVLNQDAAWLALRGPDSPGEFARLEALRQRIAESQGFWPVKQDELWKALGAKDKTTALLRQGLEDRLFEEGFSVLRPPQLKPSQGHTLLLCLTPSESFADDAHTDACRDNDDEADDLSAAPDALLALLRISFALLEKLPDQPSVRDGVLGEVVQCWGGLNDAQRVSARAYLYWLGEGLYPVTKKLISAQSPEVLKCVSLVLCVAAGRTPSPLTVKWLEKAYRTLGLECTHAYADLCSATLPRRLATSEELAPGGSHVFSLDEGRVAALRAETAQVATMLSTVFVADEPAHPAPELPAAESLSEVACALALPPAEVSLLGWMAERTPLAKAAAETEAARRGLMLAGFLESVNEAALDQYDEPLVENDDPIEFNPELIKEIF